MNMGIKRYRFSAIFEKTEMDFVLNGLIDKKMIGKLKKMGFPIISFIICNDANIFQEKEYNLYEINVLHNFVYTNTITVHKLNLLSSFEINFCEKESTVSLKMQGKFDLFDVMEDNVSDFYSILGQNDLYCSGICPRDYKGREIKFPKDDHGMRIRCEAIAGTYQNEKFYRTSAYIKFEEMTDFAF